MSSLYDELSEKVDRDPRLMKRGGPRVDLSLLLFNAREPIRRLWDAADRHAAGEADARAELAAAVEELRPIFGERSDA